MSDQRFNTGNPIGSNSPLDRSDNTRNLDVAVLSDEDTFQDRLGKSRLTWAGIVKAGSGDPAIAVDAAARAVAAASSVEQNAEQIAQDAAQQAVDSVVGAVDGAVDRAEDAADRAEAAAEAALSDGAIYPDPAAGAAATSDGEYFWVESMEGSEVLALYRNSTGAPLDTGKRTPSESLVRSAKVAADTAEVRASILTTESQGVSLIGTSSVVAGSNLSSGRTYILDSAVIEAGFINQIFLYGIDVGIAKLKVFSVEDGVATLQREGDTFSFTEGANTLEAGKDFSAIPVNPGELVAVFFQVGRIAFTTTGTAHANYYVIVGDAQGASPAGPLITTSRLEFGITLTYNRLPVSNLRSELDARLGIYEAGQSLVLQAVGTPLPDDASNLSTTQTYLIDVPVSHAGYLKQVSLFGRSAGYMWIKRFSRSGSEFTVIEEVACGFGAGSNLLAAWEDFDGMTLQPGDYLGFYVESGQITVTVPSANNNTPYYQTTGDIKAGFTAGNRFTSNRLEIGFVLAGGVPSPALQSPEVILPPYLYAVQGRECNVYLDSLFVDDASSYNIDAASPQGRHQDQRWTWVPATSVAATLSISAYGKLSGLLLDSATAQIMSAASSAGAGQTKNVLVIGDSLVAAGVITQTLLDVAAPDPMSVVLLGTRGEGANKHEGRGGWRIDDYTTAGRTFYEFTVTGVLEEPAINSTRYTNNGGTFTVQEVYLSDGSGRLVCSYTGSIPTASGVLTKSNDGSGDDTISFSSSAPVPGNPFWFDGELNFQQYLDNNSQAEPDWVFISLGINDCFGQTTDAAVVSLAEAEFSKLDLLISSIRATSSTVKVGLCIPTPPAFEQYAFGVDYSSGQTRWRFKRNILIWARELIARYSSESASLVFLIPTNVALDTRHNMRSGNAAYNSRNPDVRTVQSNGVHPAPSGYQQMGDALWAAMKCNL